MMMSMMVMRENEKEMVKKNYTNKSKNNIKKKINMLTDHGKENSEHREHLY